MDAILTYFNQFGLDFYSLLKAVGIILLGSLLLGSIGRFIFGKRSALVGALSSAIGILFVYALNIVLHSLGANYQHYTTPLPFVSVTADHMWLFPIAGAALPTLCTELVSLIILAFLMNLIDRFMPKGKNVFTWTLFRVITLILAQVAHLIVHFLMTSYLPEGILAYAPMIVLAILILLLLTGALKFLVGLFLTTVHPVIAVFYTFFFANVVGKLLTKAVLTTAILAALVYGLEALGITSICIAAGALTAYIPLMILLLVLWYFIHKIFN